MTVNDALIIRHAVDADLEALVDLKWEMNTAEHAALPPGSFIAPMLDLSREAAARAIDAHWRSQSDQRGAWFVGERAGAVIASTRWTELALGPSFKPARVGLLATVVVAASARGRGYGQRLIAHALEDMRAQGIEHAWLEVVHDNDPATRLYAAAGFVPFEIAMVKPLGDA